jgi:peptide/nickel transport system permease protein
VAASLAVRVREHELWWSLKRHPSALIAVGLLVLLLVTAFAAPLIAPQNPYDLRSLELMNSELPPIWEEDSRWPYLLGTDVQGRDMLSAILYGSRISEIIGFASVVLSLTVGLSLGLIAGYAGGRIDNVIMRVGDVLLSMPNTLTPILGVATLTFGLAILAEATLSFLGVGMPPDQPSLGTLLRLGNEFLFAGLW